MRANSGVLGKDHKEKPTFLAEVTSVERQLWAHILSKGLLHPDVQHLYQKACLSYEKLFLSDREQAELQDVEYLLWKLHYKHINEFRKTIKRNSTNSESSTDSRNITEGHVEEFTSFLSRATDYYQNLIVKVRKYYAPTGNISMSVSSEPKKAQKCKFLCHRFVICLGDLARYREQYVKIGVSNYNWAVALAHYLEAARIWPDSGNPHNQLAVLATYVGDDFLALYHCVRSLAVKQPFPDAWNNLVLLFERNNLYPLQSVPSDSLFDFSNPFKRSCVETKSRPSANMSKVEQDFSKGANLWSLFIQVMSFFFLKPSLDEFPRIFASLMKELDSIMAADDEKLNTILESYQRMDSARRGPFRTLQVISIFVFIIHNLSDIVETKGFVEGEKDKHQLELTRLALSVAFIITGRLLERCLKTNPMGSCPLLPAVLVFVECLQYILDRTEAYGIDDKTERAMSYFFGAFIDFLKQLNVQSEVSSAQKTALWEDYELRGFAPVDSIHTSLNFSTSFVNADTFRRGTEYRVQRIVSAAVQIAKRPKDSRKWIICDRTRRKFYTSESSAIFNSKESERAGCRGRIFYGKGKATASEEEEVILFKPLTRYNSAPLSPVNIKQPDSPQNSEEQNLASDEYLCRATSLLMAQNPLKGDSSFSSNITNFRFSKSFNQQESPVKDTAYHSFLDKPMSASPPSLSAWVLDGEANSGNRETEKKEKNKYELSPIDEITSASISGLLIGENENLPNCTSSHESGPSQCSPPSYSVPVPSAPLLPEDAPWFTGIEKAQSFDESSQICGNPDRSVSPVAPNYEFLLPNSTKRYGFLRFSGISSSEWLRQYREANNEGPSNKHGYFAPATLRNFLRHESPRLGLLDRYGTPTDPTIYTENSGLDPGFVPLYMGNDYGRQKILHDHQSPSAYGDVVAPDMRDDPQPLLQYLQEKEWLIQQDQTVRGPPAFLGD